MIYIYICFTPEDTRTRNWENFRKTKMALPLLRRCHRISLTTSFTRLILNEGAILSRSCKTRLTSAVATAARPYSSDGDGLKENHKVVFVGIPNPFSWLRTRIYYFLIKTYFDKEFTIEEFTEGAKQVSIHALHAYISVWVQLLLIPLDFATNVYVLMKCINYVCCVFGDSIWAV